MNSLSSGILTALVWLFLSSGLPAATHTWKGGGGDDYWSNDDNWTGGAPDDEVESFVELIFPASAQSHTTICDLSGFQAGRIIFRGSYIVNETDELVRNIQVQELRLEAGANVIFALSNNLHPFLVQMSGGVMHVQGGLNSPTFTGSGDVFIESIGSALSNSCTVEGCSLHLRAIGGPVGFTKIIASGNAVVRIEASSQLMGTPVELENAHLSVTGGGWTDRLGKLTLSGGATVNALTGGSLLQLDDTVTVGPGGIALSGINSINGHFTLGGETRDFRIDGSSTWLEINGDLADGSFLNHDTGGVRKLGDGYLGLGAAGTWRGPAIVEEGAIVASAKTALGAPGGGVQVNGAGTLMLDNAVIAGETLTLGGALKVHEGSSVWQGNIVLPSTAKQITVSQPAGYLGISGIISGPGTLQLYGEGTVELSGAAGNTYTGEAVVRNRLLRLSKASGNAIPGPLTISPVLNSLATTVLLLRDHQIADNATVLMSGSALLDLDGYTETIGGLNSFGNLSGRVQLGADTTAAGTLTVGGNGVTTEFTGKIEGARGTTLVKTGTGTLRLLAGNLTVANTFSGKTVVQSGVLELGEFQSLPGQVVVKTGAALRGTPTGSGETGPIQMDGGTFGLAQFRSEGISTIRSSGLLVAYLKGPEPGFYGHDQLRVSGSVNLSNLTLAAELSFPAVPGAEFTIIDNDRADAVSGQFNGLPEGSAFNVTGRVFTITYRGGDGNDVVLRHIGVYNNKPRVINFNYQRSADKVHLEALGPPGVLCHWQLSTNLQSWSTFASAVPDAAGILKLDQVIGLNADRIYFRLMQP